MAINRKAVIIASGESLSNAINISENETVLGIQVPSTWTSAGITFEASYDRSNFYPYAFDNAEYTITVAANQHYEISIGKLLTARAIKVRSGTSVSPVNQTASRTIYVLTVEL